MRKWTSEKKAYWQPSPAGCRALIVSIVFLALGFLTLWSVKSILNVQQDAVLVALILLPVLIFLILSGKLLEINAGGISAKFNNEAQQPSLKKGDSNITTITITRAKSLLATPDVLRNLISQNLSHYIILTIILGNGGYNLDELLEILKILAQHRNLAFLVILQQNRQVFAYTTAWQAIQILEQERDRRYASQNVRNNFNIDFAIAIMERQSEELLKYGLITETVKATDTNVAVLRRMADLNIDALIVTDENDHIKGVVERVQVLSNLMLALTEK